MSSTFFDAGDLQRLDREATLTEQAPRVLPEEDRSPDDEILDVQPEPEPDFDFILKGLLDALTRRLQ